jgi:predicted dehydrogenase
MARLKLALLGPGDVAQRDYLPEFHRIADRAELVAVCGRGEARAREVAARFGVPAWYTDAARMLASEEIDAVVNLTPIQAHAETTLAILRAGKHVYSEKPAAGSVGEAEAIRDEAARRGLVLVCAPSVLLFPQVVHARRLLADGAIGPVHAALGRGYGGVPPWAGYPSDPSQFFAVGGGSLADMGVYPLHALTGLLGPVERVSAMAARAREEFTIGDGPYAGRRIPIEVADNWHLLLNLGGERLASVTANNVAQASRAPQLEIFGLGGTIALDLLDVSAPVEVFTPEDGWRSEPVPHERAGGPDHILGVEHLVECVRTGAVPVASVDHAIHVLAILEAATESAATGRTVAPARTFAAVSV